jgi:hypothetical protein
MVETKTIGISALITLGLIASAIIGQNYFDNTNYYCDSKQIILQCPGGLSTGNGTRCYLNTEKSSYSTCSIGWIKITNDIQIEFNQTETFTPEKNNTYLKYECDNNECRRI